MALARAFSIPFDLGANELVALVLEFESVFGVPGSGETEGFVDSASLLQGFALFFINRDDFFVFCIDNRIEGLKEGMCKDCLVPSGE